MTRQFSLNLPKLTRHHNPHPDPKNALVVLEGLKRSASPYAPTLASLRAPL
jgi:hypothetical protein